MPPIDDAALEHQRCAELCTQILILNQPVKEAAKALNIKTSLARELIASPTYERLRADTLTRLGVVEEAWRDKALKRIQSLSDRAIDVFADSMDDEKAEIRLRAAENIADRAGLARQAAAEVKHIVSLDQETVDRMARAAREADAIDVTAASMQDFAYASQRPITSPLRDSPSERAHAHGVPQQGQAQHVLHGQGHPRLRGPDAGVPWLDGKLDSAADEEEARLSPA